MEEHDDEHDGVPREEEAPDVRLDAARHQQGGHRQHEQQGDREARGAGQGLGTTGRTIHQSLVRSLGSGLKRT